MTMTFRNCVEEVLSVTDFGCSPRFVDGFFHLCLRKAKRTFAKKYPEEYFSHENCHYEEELIQASAIMLDHLCTTIFDLLENNQKIKFLSCIQKNFLS